MGDVHWEQASQPRLLVGWRGDLSPEGGIGRTGNGWKYMHMLGAEQSEGGSWREAVSSRRQDMPK